MLSCIEQELKRIEALACIEQKIAENRISAMYGISVGREQDEKAQFQEEWDGVDKGDYFEVLAKK